MGGGGRLVSNWVFYTQSTITVISGQRGGGGGGVSYAGQENKAEEHCEANKCPQRTKHWFLPGSSSRLCRS